MVADVNRLHQPPTLANLEERKEDMKFRKKPVIIEAIQWLGTMDSLGQIREFMRPNYPHVPKLPDEASKPILIVE